jgi:hypothetical protein
MDYTHSYIFRLIRFLYTASKNHISEQATLLDRKATRLSWNFGIIVPPKQQKFLPFWEKAENINCRKIQVNTYFLVLVLIVILGKHVKSPFQV